MPAGRTDLSRGIGRGLLSATGARYTDTLFAGRTCVAIPSTASRHGNRASRVRALSRGALPGSDGSFGDRRRRRSEPVIRAASRGRIPPPSMDGEAREALLTGWCAVMVWWVEFANGAI